MKMPQAHWAAPALMMGSLFVGILLALGHHLFYASLDHTLASAALDEYDVFGMQISAQQFNTAVGTAFAFLVRACLMLSISTSYFQMLMWTVTKPESKGTKLGHLDVMSSVLQDWKSLMSFAIWWRRPWLWILAIIAWLIPIASIVTPATLSVGVDFPPLISMHVPNVDFSSLNLVAPMTAAGTTASGPDTEPGFTYDYTGPSSTVQRIAGAVAAQGAVLPVAAPFANSTWNMTFNGPSLHCNPVASDFRMAVLDNILNSTLARNWTTTDGNCSFGSGYMAWHPQSMNSDISEAEYLPFIRHGSDFTAESPGDLLNNYNDHQHISADLASMFVAITPTFFGSVSDGHPKMCLGKPWYQASLAEYYNISTVLRCDIHNSTYSAKFSFVNGEQEVDVASVTDITSAPMPIVNSILAYLGSTVENDTDLKPQACPSYFKNIAGADANCLSDTLSLTTLSYQAVMHAFAGLVTGVVSKGDPTSGSDAVTSTSRLGGTVLADVPELAFIQQSTLELAPSAQQRAATWDRQPFAGLVNAGATPQSTLALGEAFEQLFQNITFSLMSDQDLQPNSSSIYYPAQTVVRSTTRQNIYVYAACKLWLAYGLAIGATAVIVLCGLTAVVWNGASFSDKFSTILRLSRGAELSREIGGAEPAGRDPLPRYAKEMVVGFSREGKARTEDRHSVEYPLVDMKGQGADAKEREVNVES